MAISARTFVCWRIRRLAVINLPLHMLVVALSLGSGLRAAEIHKLIEDGKIDKAKAVLVKHPRQIDALDGLQQTPLHVAAHRGRLEMVKFLLDRGGQSQCAGL